jgi:class III poly(R)-hydroxyalkanoic acid synthase PhaE subunit
MSEDNSNKQEAGVMQSLMDAQRVLWQAWTDTVSKTYEKEISFSEMADEWQKQTMQSVQAWGSAVDPIARSTAEQFICAQGNALRCLNLVERARETAAPKLKSGEDWRKALNETLTELSSRWANMPGEMSAMNQDIESLWKLYRDQWRAFGQPWENVLMGAPGLWGRAVTGDTSALFELTDVYHEAYKQTFGRLTASPSLGITREFNSRLLEGFDAFSALNLAKTEYLALLAEIWESAFKKFGDELTGLVEKGGKIENVRDLVRFWTRCSEDVFLEAFRGERYTLVQGKMLNANMQYRISQRRIMEKYLEAFDMPTRREVDEAHRRIYDLNKVVKVLKRQIEELKAAEVRRPRTPKEKKEE